MSGREHSGRHPALHGHRQLEQPDGVRDHRTAASEPVGEFGVRHAELDQQLLVGGGLLQRVELDPVDVLQQRVAQQDVVARPPHDGRDARETRPLRRPPAPLAHDELVPPGPRLADDDRLQQPELPDRVLEFRKRLLVEDSSRLLRVRLDRLDVDVAVVGRARRCFTWNIRREGARGRAGPAEQDGGGVRRGRAHRRGRRRRRRRRRLRGWGTGRDQGGESASEPAPPLGDLPLDHARSSLEHADTDGCAAPTVPFFTVDRSARVALRRRRSPGPRRRSSWHRGSRGRSRAPSCCSRALPRP